MCLSCGKGAWFRCCQVCIGCFTSSLINSAPVLVRLKLCVLAVQLMETQVQKRLQIPPAEWRGIDWYAGGEKQCCWPRDYLVSSISYGRWRHLLSLSASSSADTVLSKDDLVEWTVLAIMFDSFFRSFKEISFCLARPCESSLDSLRLWLLTAWKAGIKTVLKPKDLPVIFVVLWNQQVIFWQ